MKKLKTTAILFICTLVIGMLSGCGNSFDASAYLKALLDNSYKNDSTEFVAQKIGTKEEAEELYQQGIDAELSAATSDVTLSDELLAGFEETFQNIFQKVKYTVKDAKKQSDGSYVVTVEYEQLEIFAAVMENYQAEVEQWSAQMTEDVKNGQAVPSDEEIYEELYKILKADLDSALENPSYAEKATTTVTIELNDNTYTPKEADLIKLESLFIDIDSMN